MKQGFVVASVVALFAGFAVAQEEDRTVETATTTTVSSGADLIGELWSVNDTTTLPEGQVDLRFTFGWMTDWEISSGDDFVLQPSLLWGACDASEVSVRVPVWLGKGGDAGPFEDGNGDTTIGVLWRLADQVDYWPSLALSAEGRFPTGDHSSGVDGKLTLLLTNEYGSGLRSHFNAFGQTLNGDNFDNPGDSSQLGWGRGRNNFFNWLYGNANDGFREFRWGASVGLDGPLCDDGAVRWVFDYAVSESYSKGESALHVVDIGWEWNLGDGQMLGMGGRFNLDHDAPDVPNYGVNLTYSLALTQ